MGRLLTQVVDLSAPHTAKHASIVRRLATLRKSAVANLVVTTLAPRQLRHQPARLVAIRHLTISNIRNVTANEPAPLVKVLVTSANGSCELQALPDSGADISAAGKETLQTLNEHVNSLITSRVIHKAANGMKMYPLGKIPVKIQLGCYEHSEELHIYPNISGTLLSWKACKSLGTVTPIPSHLNNRVLTRLLNTPKPCQSWNHPHLTTS